MASRLRYLVDFRFSDSGDFVLDTRDNDLMDTKEENFQGAIQRIVNRLQSSKGDWKASPQTGASLIRFAGRPNSPSVGAEIEIAVKNEFIRDGFLRSGEVSVQVFPISKTALGILVHITPDGQRQTMQIALSYDLQDNKVSLRN